jgi:putative selenate reductase
MAELVPLPFGRLVARMFKELERDRAIFDLGVEKFFRPDPARDLSVGFHGRRAATPLGPAAGPHSQLAQNIVLSFLGGARVIELKTVQIMDELAIPRPCIDVATVGYNVEWSQELKLEQSLEEYVKASMLIEILVESGALGLPPASAPTIFDMSVGYDLAGIRTERVRAFIRGMMDAAPLVDRLRREIPAEHARYRDLEFTTRLSDTLTLSTFHGCPPDEIERIIDHLLHEHSLHCVVKLNPTLLGPVEARRIFHDALGHAERIPDEAFAKDTRWEQAVDFVGRLGDTARGLGLGFGVKLTNTLIVENHKSFFSPSEKQMYLSGPPLHVLAMALVGRFRETFGAGLPISFSAGIDRHNFADAVSLGLVPVTVCTDLLKPGGYGRMRYYFGDLGKRMVACGARDLDELGLVAQGEAEAALAAIEGSASAETIAACRAALGPGGDPRAAAGPELFARWLAEARVRGSRRYLEKILADPRYAAAANAKPPTKVGTRLWLFECLTCDKCIPVCPNDANFAYTLPKIEIPVVKLRASARHDGGHPHTPGGGLAREEGAPLRLEKKHQIATYADFCNECGNCDVFCPEDGGPYVLKPRFFGSEQSFARFASHDGFFVARAEGVDTVLGRFEGKAFRAEIRGEEARFAGPGFDVRLSTGDPEATVEGPVEPDAVIDLTYFRIMDWLRRGVLDGPGVNYVNT